MALDSRDVRYKGILDYVQKQDPDVVEILFYSSFVVAHFLQQNGLSPGWRKAHIEGTMYVVRRRSRPQYQLLASNQYAAVVIFAMRCIPIGRWIVRQITSCTSWRTRPDESFTVIVDYGLCMAAPLLVT